MGHPVLQERRNRVRQPELLKPSDCTLYPQGPRLWLRFLQAVAQSGGCLPYQQRRTAYARQLCRCRLCRGQQPDRRSPPVRHSRRARHSLYVQHRFHDSREQCLEPFGRYLRILRIAEAERRPCPDRQLPVSVRLAVGQFDEPDCLPLCRRAADACRGAGTVGTDC